MFRNIKPCCASRQQATVASGARGGSLRLLGRPSVRRGAMYQVDHACFGMANVRLARSSHVSHDPAPPGSEARNFPARAARGMPSARKDQGALGILTRRRTEGESSKEGIALGCRGNMLGRLARDGARSAARSDERVIRRPALRVDHDLGRPQGSPMVQTRRSGRPRPSRSWPSLAAGASCPVGRGAFDPSPIRAGRAGEGAPPPPDTRRTVSLNVC